MIIGGLLLIWISVGGLGWLFGHGHGNEVELINQLRTATELIKDLSLQIDAKDILILQYQDDILNWHNQCKSLIDKLNVTEQAYKDAVELINYYEESQSDDS